MHTKTNNLELDINFNKRKKDKKNPKEGPAELKEKEEIDLKEGTAELKYSAQPIASSII